MTYLWSGEQLTDWIEKSPEMPSVTMEYVRIYFHLYLTGVHAWA